MKLIVTKDIQALATLVNEICDCDVFSKRRVRKHVDGRMIFSKVLAKKGLTLTDIRKESCDDMLLPQEDRWLP